MGQTAGFAAGHGLSDSLLGNRSHCSDSNRNINCNTARKGVDKSNTLPKFHTL